jgi:hypothetical protein
LRHVMTNLGETQLKMLKRYWKTLKAMRNLLKITRVY